MEIVQLLLNRANGTEHIKRMLDAVDSEGDTVSIYLLFLKFEFLIPIQYGKVIVILFQLFLHNFS